MAGTTTGFRSFSLVIIAAVTIAVSCAGSVSAGWPTAGTGEQSNMIHEPTRVKSLDPFFFQSAFFPAFGDDTKVTTIVRRYPFDPRDLGMKKAKGVAMTDHSCIGRGREQSLGRQKDKFDGFGNGVTTKRVPADRSCDFFRTETSFKGNQRQAADSSVSVLNNIQRLPEGVSDDCFAQDVLCLQDGRFKVEVDWRSFTSSGEAVPIATGFDAGTFYFFNPASTELLVKVLDQCSFNDHFWVFAAAATDVEFTLTVTDTTNNVMRTYDNGLGQPAQPVLDTSAFATCP